MPLIKGKFKLVNTSDVPLTTGFLASDFSDGAHSANSLNSNLYTSVGDVFSWYYDGAKYFTNGDSFAWLAKSKVMSRDHEITVNAGAGTIYLRVDNTGKAWFLNFNYNNGLFKLGVCDNANTAGAALDTLGTYGYLFSGGAPFTGFYQSASATNTLTFGCSGFEIYVKWNGVDKIRYKSPHHCKPGLAGVKMFFEAASYLRTFTYQSFPRSFTYSDTDSDTVDVRDFGAIPNASTVGSMVAASNQITVADASKLPIGATVIVATGGEAIVGIGSIGVGNAYPALHYPDEATMYLDRSQTIEGVRCYVDTTMKCYVNSIVDNTWYPASEPYYVAGELALTNPYDEKAIPLALRAKITNKVGNLLTLSKSAAVSTTNAGVYLDSSYAFSRLVMDAAENYFREDYPETVPTDMSFAAVVGRKVHMPQGNYYVGEDIILTQPDIEWYGDGNNETVIIAPNGASAFNVFAKGPHRSYTHDFKCIGNTRIDTYSGRWEAWYSDTAGRVNNQYYNLTNGHSTPWGFGYITTDDAVLENVTFVDIWWLAGGMKQACNRCYRKNIRVERTAPLLCYVQWFYQDGNCPDGTFENCHFDSDWLHPAFETFDTERTHFINCTMRNGILSFNNAGHFIASGCQQLFDGAQPRMSWMHPSGPAVNVNTNIGANKFAGLIEDHSIVVTGYQDAFGDSITGIIVNSANEDIIIRNSSYSGVSKIGSYGPRAIISTGINITVDGFVASGNIPGDGFYNCNVAVSNGTIKRVVAPSIYVNTGVVIGTGADANTGTITVV
jgi:hypothetical protein